MIAIHENYIVDEDGKKKAVVVSMGEWEKVLDALDELDAIRAYDEAKSQSSEPIPFEQAVREIQEGKPS